jgi:hypothetical protein
VFTCLRRDAVGRSIEPTRAPTNRMRMIDRRCFYCSTQASWLLVDRNGILKGFVCEPCQEKQSRKRNVWHRRIRRRIRNITREH